MSLIKVNKEFGSPRKEGNKISSNEMNEVSGEDKGQHNKSPNRKSEELKDITEKPYRNAVVEYKMNGSEKREDYKHTAKINWKNIAISRI